MKVYVSFKRLNKNASIPKFSYNDDAGFDICSVDSITIKAGECAVLKSGLAWSAWTTDATWRPYLQLKGRSGLSIKYGIEMCNAGVIDAGYRGEINIKLYNTSKIDYEIKVGDRIAQGIVYLLPSVTIEEVEELEESETGRGSNGLGSTGK